MGAFAAARGAGAERPAKQPRVRGRAAAPRSLALSACSPAIFPQAGMGRHLLLPDGAAGSESDEDEEDEEEDEEDDEGEGDPRKRFESIAARYAEEAEAAGEKERAERRKRQAAGGAYFASRRRGATSTASLADLDLAGAAQRFRPVCSVLCSPLCTRPADEAKIRSLLLELEVGHLAERKRLAARYENELYPRWRALLHAGFSVLVYGFGSKKLMLEDFANRYCLDGGVAVVNGFFPELKLRQLLATCCAALSPTAAATDFRGKPPAALLAHIAAAAGAGRRLYLVLHGADGAALRTSDAVAALATLAATPGVHLLASADHVNFPLLWPKRAAAKLNWAWEHAPTYAPYVAETAALPQILASRGEARLTRGAATVLRSLTPNARAIFRVLADETLAHPEEHGLPLARLSTLCREQFLVASETTLKMHLTEYYDHGIVKRVKRGDGAEVLALPFSPDDIQQILDDIEDAG